MSKIADLVVSLSADIASFRSGMEEASDHLAAIRQQSSDTGGALQSLQQSFEGVVSVEALRRVADFGATLVESAAHIGHLSEALGISAGNYQALAYAAQQAGVPAEGFAGIMEKLSKNLEMMATQASSPAKVFADLGLSATNLDGSVRSAADTLQDLATNKIFLSENATQQLGQVMTITGARMGDATLIVNALKNGTLDLVGAQKKAQAEGAAYSDQTIADAEALETRVSAAWQKIKVSIGTAVVYAAAHPLDFLLNPMAGMESNAPEGGPTQAAASAGRKPPGPAVVDPTRTTELQSFQETYTKLLQTEQEDADYQAKLRVAYQQGAAAVAQVEAAHAADRAQLELLEAAQRDHVTATQAEIVAVRDAAAANAMNTKAAAEQKQLDDALAQSQKKYADQVATVMNETDGLTDKQNKLADTLGILEAQYKSGAISLEDYAQRAAAAKQLIDSVGADKGIEEFTKGLSSDFSELIGKATDFSALIENKNKNPKDTILAQLTQDANEFTASLEKLLLKLLIINPLLNELGLGDEGNGKQLPTLLGNSGGAGGSAGTNSPFSGVASSIEGGGKSVLGFLSGLFGGTTANVAADADSATGASLNSDIVDALTGSGLGGGMGDPFSAALGDGLDEPFDLPGFAEGGDFTVGGNGGTDTKRVSFLATPGERVSVMPEVGSRSHGDSSSRHESRAPAATST